MKMKKSDNKLNEFSLGELIYELFEESRKVTNQPAEQKVLVYAALKDLLGRKLNTSHPIVLSLSA